MQKLISESISGRAHPDETSGVCTRSVLQFMQQHTTWTEEQILAEVMKKNFESPIYGTYQLLCSKIRGTCVADDSYLLNARRGSRGSITSGKVNIEMEAPAIPAHHFAKLNFSSIDNSESDRSDASGSDELTATAKWVNQSSSHLGLVVGDQAARSSSFREGGRRHSLCTENMLSPATFSSTQQILANQSKAFISSFANLGIKDGIINQFPHSLLPCRYVEPSIYSMHPEDCLDILPLPSLERRASADEAMWSVAGGYHQLGSSYAMSNLVTSHRNSLINSRLRSSIPNNLTIDDGERYLYHYGSFKRSTFDCIFGTDGVSTSVTPSVRFAGSPYAKQNEIERRRSWAPSNQNVPYNAQQEVRLKRLSNESNADENSLACGILQLQKEFEQLKVSADSLSAFKRTSLRTAASSSATKRTPRISITDENECCTKLASFSLYSPTNCDETKNRRIIYGYVDKRDSNIPAHSISLNCGLSLREALLQLNSSLDELCLSYKRDSGTFNKPPNEECSGDMLHANVISFSNETGLDKQVYFNPNQTYSVRVSSFGTELIKLDVSLIKKFSKTKLKVNFYYLSPDSVRCERLCFEIGKYLQLKFGADPIN